MWWGLFITSIMSVGITMPATGTTHSDPTLQIVAVSPGSATNSRQEFIELYNGGDTIIDFDTGDTWVVQIASSGAHDWSAPIRTITLKGYLYPGNHYVIGTSYTQSTTTGSETVTYPNDADITFASALSAGGGHIRLMRSNEGADTNDVIDEYEYGTATTVSLDGRKLYRSQKELSAGTTLSRRYDQSQGRYEDSDDDTVDFMTTTDGAHSTTVDQPDLPPPAPKPDVTDQEPVTQSSTPLRITELLPNPAPPASDTTDEYIELYNDSDNGFDASGYVLRSGLVTYKTYQLPAATIIPAHTYLTLYAKATKLSLSNSGGQLALISPDGTVVAQTNAYGMAKDGLVWQLYDNTWQWSNKQTPNAANEQGLVAPPVATSPSSTKAVAKVDKTNVVKTKKATTAKKPTTKKITETIKTAAITPEPKAFIHTTVLVVVLTCAVLYGIYEYRHELAALFSRRRTDRADRPHDRPPIKGG